MSEVILELKNLKKYFPLPGGQSVKAVDGVSLKLFKGETLGLVGESGCGKSTIAYTVVGMYGATEGEIIYKGTNLAQKVIREICSKRVKYRSFFRIRAHRLIPDAMWGKVWSSL